ncbi:hypothetical protein Ddye_013697 [Dipteronia dyeriana]|uniref:C2 NT-type domain-containing protein n=1 Tax=Dipteronia dyeriana TaxID=168575 RepID=A0AAD9X6Y9_9ROSI|nr:hypothetical protein Ddye_013697 [Dipteronia dyeriana]
MFKSWRNDRTKIKAVFKLQFQATQVPRLKKSAVMISLVPEDAGKPTVKLEKVAVQDGTCTWENPLYEIVKLIRETKTGKIKEKIYHFIVSTGSSKSGFLGEASIDFADFAAETEPLTVTLPLKFANSGAILHVTIQRAEGVNDQRDTEENGGMALPQVTILKNQQSNYKTDRKEQDFAENGHLDIAASQNGKQIGSFRASTGSRTTFASCWDEQNIQQDPDSLHSPYRQNSMPQRGTVGAVTTKNRAHRRTNTDWSVGSVSDGSLFDSINSPEDNLPREWQEGSDGSVEKLRNEIAMMMRQAELTEIELQSLRKQMVKESKRAQDQTRQVISLSEERDSLRTECKQLRRQKSIDDAAVQSQLQSENDHLRAIQEEIRQELNHEKEMKTNLQLQLQKTQDSNSELMLAVEDLNEILEQKNREIETCNSAEGEHQLALKELAKNIEMLRQKVGDRDDEIEFFSKHTEELEMHMEQLTQDNEVLKQENSHLSSKLEQKQLESIKTCNESSESLATIKELESQVERLEEKMKQQSQDYSESLVAINELESQVKRLNQELEKQAQEFEDDLDAVTSAKTEQEQRAIRAEEALRNTRWKNAVSAERLQEEFKRLSVDMASKLDENDKLAMNAHTEANELRMQKKDLEELLLKSKDELDLMKDQIEEMSLELDDKSKQLECAQKSEEQKLETFAMEVQMLKTEIQKLKMERNNLSEQAEQRDDTEQILSIGETAMLVERWNKERNDLEKKIALAKKEAEKAHEELISMRFLRDENKMMVGNLQSEVKKLKVQHGELKNSLIEVKLEKDNLRKQVFQLKDELQKKEEEITSIEKEFENYGGKAPVTDVQMTSSLMGKLKLLKEHLKLNEVAQETSANSGSVRENNLSIKTEEQESTIEQVKITPVHGYKHATRKEETCSEKKLNLSTSHASNAGNLTELLSEVTLLKEKNKHMETELKEMQERYSEISLKFAEVEGERQKLVMTVRNLKNGKKN